MGVKMVIYMTPEILQTIWLKFMGGIKNKLKDIKMKTKKISIYDLKVGDKIKTFDEVTGGIVFKEVTDKWDTIVEPEHQALVQLSNDNKIECSINHPFMVINTTGVLIEVKPPKLSIGDIVKTDNEVASVVNVTIGRDNPSDYIDITVENTHTFFTSNTETGDMILTHNSQGGVRGGAATVHVLLWHPEIENILVLKNNKGTQDNRVRNLDYSILINNFLYQRLIDNGVVTLFSPHDVPDLYDAYFTDSALFEELYIKYERRHSIVAKKVSARELFASLMIERKDTGRIYIMNVDNVNEHSSFKDPIRMSNLCQEITLVTEPMGSTETYEIYVPNDDLMETINQIGQSDLVPMFEIKNTIKAIGGEDSATV
jgi:hypothetical protein